MNKKDTNESNLLFPVPDSGDIASDVWRLILRNNAKMLNLLQIGRASCRERVSLCV